MLLKILFIISNGENRMRIKLEMGEWIIDDEYFITNGLNGYEVYTCGSKDSEAKEVYTCGSKDSEAKEVYASESFEECLTWIYNSL